MRRATCTGHLVAGDGLLVAGLHAGAGLGGEELRLPDAVGEVEDGAAVAAGAWSSRRSVGRH